MGPQGTHAWQWGRRRGVPPTTSQGIGNEEVDVDLLRVYEELCSRKYGVVTPIRASNNKHGTR